MQNISRELVDWYWSFGCQREGRFELGLGTWGARLHDCLLLSDTIDRSQGLPRPAFAIWGPSQTGKSTLVSSYLDAGADEQGNASALHWPGGVPARFVGKFSPGRVVLNPYNLNSDGSGCVSRYRLAEIVEDPSHPVEIRFCDRRHLLAALALGYLSECKVVRDDGATHLDENVVDRRLEQLARESASPASSSTDQAAYLFVLELADLLQTLCMMRQPRYIGLGGADFRRRLLECPWLLESVDHVEQFAADLLWDGHQPLTKLYRYLMAQRADWLQRTGSLPLHCSLSLAAALLNCLSYQYMVSSDEHTRFMIDGMRVTFDRDRGRASIGSEGTQPAFSRDLDFAFFQGLVLELIIPVHRPASAEAPAGLFRFLEEADLLDFPGTAQEDDQTLFAELDLQAITKENQSKLFTRVLKRGKTASVVALYAKEATIDGFVIMNRLGQKVRKPEQLATGVFTWWKSFDERYQPESYQERSPLPLNFVFTFCARALNDLGPGGMPEAGLEEWFSDLEKLGPLAHPNVVHHTLAINYPHLPDGHCQIEGENKRALVGRILSDRHFLRQFCTEDGKQSFREAVDNGGTEFLFRLLRQQIDKGRRNRLLMERQQRLRERIRALLVEAVPSYSHAAENRKRLLLEWKESLKRAIKACEDPDAVATASYLLRIMFDVDPDALGMLPASPATQRLNSLRMFIEIQLGNWVDSRVREPRLTNNLQLLGISDSEQLSRLLHSFAEEVDSRNVARWMQDNLGGATSVEQRRSGRRFLSIYLSNTLLRNGRAEGKGYPIGDLVQKDLVTMFDAVFGDDDTDDRNSPHWRRVIRPVLDAIERAAQQPTSVDRPSQPGDDELLQLLQDYPEFLIQEG